MGAGIWNKLKKFDMNGIGNIIGGVTGALQQIGQLVGGNAGNIISQIGEVGGNLANIGTSLIGQFM